MSPEIYLRAVGDACVGRGPRQASRPILVFQFAVGSDADGNTIHVLHVSFSNSIAFRHHGRISKKTLGGCNHVVPIGKRSHWPKPIARCSATLCSTPLSEFCFSFFLSAGPTTPRSSVQHPCATFSQPLAQNTKKARFLIKPRRVSLIRSLGPHFLRSFFSRYVAIGLASSQSVPLCISSSSYQRSVYASPSGIIITADYPSITSP